MDNLITVRVRSDLYGLKGVLTDQLAYCSKDNVIYHLKDVSRKNKKDGWEQTGAIPTQINTSGTTPIPPSSIYITQALGDVRYVRYQQEYILYPNLAPQQDIYGDIIVHGNISATGEVSAFTADAPTNWWLSMPYASATTVGGIKVGANLTIDANGVLNASGGAGSAAWGAISGTLTDQTDLVTAFGLKADLDDPSFTTKITVTGDILSSGRIVGGGLASLDSTAHFQGKIDTTISYQYLMRFKDEAGTIGFLVTNGVSAGNFFPVFTGKVTSTYPGLYFVGNCVNGPGSGAAILGFDGRRNNGAANASDILIGFSSGYGNYKAVIMGDGKLGVGTLTPDEAGHIVGNLHVTGNIYAEGEVSAFTATPPSSDYWLNVPHATTSVYGTVKIGSGLTIDGSGFLTADAGSVGVTDGDKGDIVVSGTGTIWMIDSGVRANWDTAYTDRMKWDGGATGLVAATGRTSLGLASGATADISLYAPIANPTFTGTVNGITYSMVGAEVAGAAASAISTHESTYNHSNYNTAYLHSQNNDQAHTDYLKNNADDSTSGILTAAGFKIGDYTIAVDTTKFVVKYGATIIFSCSTAGYVKAKDEVSAFDTP